MILQELRSAFEDSGHARYCPAAKEAVVGEYLGGDCECGYERLGNLLDKLEEALKEAAEDYWRGADNNFASPEDVLKHWMNRGGN